MTKKYKILILIIVNMLFLGGCASAITPESTEASIESNSSKENTDLLSKLKVEEDHIYGELSDKISVDFKNANLLKNPGKYAEVDVKEVKLDYQVLSDAFFGKSVKLNTSNDKNYGFTATYKDKANNYFYYTDLNSHIYATSDFTFQTENIFRNTLREGIGGASAQWNTTKFFKTDEDLSFMPMKIRLFPFLKKVV